MTNITATPNSTQRGYGYRWQKAREAHLRKHPLCVKCQELNRVTAATVVDHREPHRLGEAIQSGDPERIAEARARFWNKAMWQSLCSPHHNSDKQREEKSGRVIGCDEQGVPLDPESHWNRERRAGSGG